MNRSATVAAGLGLALLLAACSSGKSGASGSKKPGPSQRICSAVAAADLTSVLGKAPKGSPKDVPGGHGCVWTNGAGSALAVVVYATAGDVPNGDNSAKTMADSVGLDKSGFSSSSITTSTGKKPVALLLLTSGSQPADTAAQGRITDAAVGAG